MGGLVGLPGQLDNLHFQADGVVLQLRFDIHHGSLLSWSNPQEPVASLPPMSASHACPSGRVSN
jgi:hypothetical protein